MRLSWGGRIGLLLVGVVVGLVGAFLWALEAESAPVGLEAFSRADGIVGVWEGDLPDRARGDTAAMEAAGARLVFSGTQAEADTYIEERQAEARSYFIPGVIIGIGVVVAIVALIPARKRRTEQEPLVSV